MKKRTLTPLIICVVVVFIAVLVTALVVGNKHHQTRRKLGSGDLERLKLKKLDVMRRAREPRTGQAAMRTGEEERAAPAVAVRMPENVLVREDTAPPPPTYAEAVMG